MAAPMEKKTDPIKFTVNFVNKAFPSNLKSLDNVRTVFSEQKSIQDALKKKVNRMNVALVCPSALDLVSELIPNVSHCILLHWVSILTVFLRFSPCVTQTFAFLVLEMNNLDIIKPMVKSKHLLNCSNHL